MKTLLCDLGTAEVKEAAVDATLLVTSRNPLTPAKFLPPECGEASCRPCGKAGDIWCTGCTLAELFSGAPLWDLKGIPQARVLQCILDKKKMSSWQMH